MVLLTLQREPGIRVRALFVDNMSGPVLQMLGARYVLFYCISGGRGASNFDPTGITWSLSSSALVSTGYRVDTR